MKPSGSEGSMKPSPSALFQLMTQQQQRIDTSLLDMSASTKYDNFRYDHTISGRLCAERSSRRIYADILYLWGFQEKAAEVLKFVAMPAPEHKGVGTLLLASTISRSIHLQILSPTGRFMAYMLH
jgi:hypothetical protein